MDTSKTQGVISAWTSNRAFGFIVTEEFVPRSFFFHLSNVIDGVELIAVGRRVSFNVNPVREGKRYSAIDVEVGEMIAGVTR